MIHFAARLPDIFFRRPFPRGVEMRKFAAIGCMFALFGAFCAADDPKPDKDTIVKPDHESLMKDMLKTMNELVGELEKVKDKMSAESVKPRIKLIADRMEALVKTVDALPKL